MQTKTFQRRKENFVCENCGFEVIGNGFTNHCPRCLWSKHVDINPGDRQAPCRGLMKPVSFEVKKGRYRVLHRCVKCGFKRWNKVADGDDIVGFVESVGVNN